MSMEQAKNSLRPLTFFIFENTFNMKVPPGITKLFYKKGECIAKKRLKILFNKFREMGLNKKYSKKVDEKLQT